MSKPVVLISLAAALGVAVASPVWGQQRLDAVRIGAFSATPVFVCSPPGDLQRRFVVTRDGRIWIANSFGVLPTPFLDIHSQVILDVEGGLLGLAFHPAYTTNGYFYVYYSGVTGSSGGVIVARYRVSQSNPDQADVASATTVMIIQRTQGNHYAGWMEFGPDGLLYIASGDSGNYTTSQNLASPLGNLRIDVNGDDFPADPLRNYSIPPTNPFAMTVGAAPEIWAYGLRNPWRNSFDRFTGDLWIADVGENQREEIDFQPSAASPFTALNYGWPCMEGTLCHQPGGGCTCGQPGLTLPLLEYDHSVGNAIMGGYVYRGSALPWFQGSYLFGDYSGRVWSFRYANGAITEFTDRRPELGLPLASVTSFGQDADGELYVCLSSPNVVLKIVPYCYANCDHSTIQPVLNVSDFVCFLNRFAAEDTYANCDNSTTPPILNVNDFACFLSAFAAGCP